MSGALKSKKSRNSKKSAAHAEDVEPKYFDDFFAAEILGVSVHTLRNDRRMGRGPKYCRMGKLVRYTRVWCVEYAERHVVDPTAA